MKIKISNFGPVREFSIDLKTDFHLLVGRNNIGKSYAITAIYLIVKNFSSFSSHSLFGFEHLFIDGLNEHNEVSNSLNEVINTGRKLKPRQEISIDKYVLDDLANAFGKAFLQKLNNSFSNTFTSLDNLTNRYSNEAPTISIKQNGFSFDLIISNSKFTIANLKNSKKFVLKSIKQNREPINSQDKCTVYYCKDKDSEFERSYSINVIFKNLMSFISDFTNEISSVHYLPASRSGLYQALSAFGQIIAELSKNRSFLSKKIELPGISEPVSDYFIRLSDIRVQKRNFENKDINKIAQEIEDRILKGKVEFNSQTKQLMFYPNETNLKLELSSTSSMVSELAPIVSYLRYVLTAGVRQRNRGGANPSHLIMIEEPEAHLHPEVQIMLTEIFAKLVNANVKLIITSHSNYIFNKVNNLIMAKGLDPERVNSAVFKATCKGSIVTKLEVNELGVEDDNFNEATSDLFEEKMDIISKINEDFSLND